MDPGNDTYVWDRAPEKFSFIVGEAAYTSGDTQWILYGLIDSVLN
jgi:hypothetical protein